MGLKKGDTCAIGFTEKEESFVNKEGKTINYTDHFILSLREASGVPPRLTHKRLVAGQIMRLAGF